MKGQIKSEMGRSVSISNVEQVEFENGGLEECVEAVRADVGEKVRGKLGVEPVEAEDVRKMALMSLHREVSSIKTEDVLELNVLVSVPEEAGFEEALMVTIEDALNRVAGWNDAAATESKSVSKRAQALA